MYYIYSGIIDNFNFTLSKEEAFKSYVYDNIYLGVSDVNDAIEFRKRLEKLEEIVKATIYKEEKEYPCIIRYFGIPGYECYEVLLCVVAKVNNNGSTYIFSEDKEFLERYNDGYKEIKRVSI